MPETLFTTVSYPLDYLVNSIELGQIGLPDLQRPFVWKPAKVRDLFDSMYRGYPVGYLLFWKNGFDGGTKNIGVGQKQSSPDLLIVDGQQRLTSLFAVFRGIPVLRDNYKEQRIDIAFNPLEETFEVADAAVRRDPSFIPDISKLWDPSIGTYRFVREFLEKAESLDRELSEDDRRKIESSIERLAGLKSYAFTVLVLSSRIDEEQVSEVFVRINSKGIPLNQADFILTLMSVFWDEGRKQLEGFCRDARQPSVGGASPFNHFLLPDPDQLLRVSIGLGFQRARLKYVYSILRGKDLETGDFSEERREEQFGVLKQAQERTLHLQYWHDFFRALELAGVRGGGMITSKNALIFTYVFYLIGRTELKVEEALLRRTVSRWFFMASLTGRYTSSPESSLEFDLAGLRGVTTPEAFVATLERIIANTLTKDFWEITLPNDLATSSARSPALFAYYAALVLLDAKALFSDHRIVDLLDPSVHANRAAAERHHLFPKAYLKSIGITGTRDTNQIANYAITEWTDNAAISDTAPGEYLPGLLERCDPKDAERMYYWHALPDGWESMSYPDFLAARRERIAEVIRAGFATLEPKDKVPLSLDEVAVSALVAEGEGKLVEFKSTLRTNLHTGQKDERMEKAVLKTIAGFLNSNDGGTLVMGIADDGELVGLEVDGFANEDKMALHLTNLRSRIGADKMLYVHPRFEDHDGGRVFAVECLPSRSPVFLKDGNFERFYVRTGPSTTELTPSQTDAYVRQRWG